MDVDYSKKMGKNLSALRQTRKLTQERFAAKLQVEGCDLTRSAIAKIEVGQRHLYPDELAAIKIVLDCNYDDLFV